MAKFISIFALVVFFSIPANATSPCYGLDEAFKQAPLVVVGEFVEEIQQMPNFQCSQNSVTFFSQCLGKIKQESLSYSSRILFRVDNILKINKKLSGSWSESIDKNGNHKIGMKSIVIEGSKDIIGKSGIFAATSGKNQFNDFIFGKCNFYESNQWNESPEINQYIDKYKNPLVEE